MKLTFQRYSVQYRVGAHWSVNMARYGSPLKACQVPTLKEPDEVSR